MIKLETDLERNLRSWAVLKNLVLKEDVEQVLCSQGLGQPAGHLNVEILLRCSLAKDFLELIDKHLVLLLEFVELSGLVFNLSVLFSQLMSHWVGLVVVNAVELADLFLSVSFHVVDLVLDQRVKLLFFSIPSDGVLAEFSSEFFFVVLEELNFQVACSDFVLSCLNDGLKFFDDAILFINLLLQILKVGLVLSLLEVSKLLEIFDILKLDKKLPSHLFWFIFRGHPVSW